MKARRWALAAAAALVMGCASVDKPAPQTEWIQGRLLVRIDAIAARPASSNSAAFELRGDSKQGELRLNSPLGTRLATARWAPGQVRLMTPDGVLEFTSLDEMSVQILGEALPLAALPDWLMGKPWPLAAHQPSSQGFEQLGWSVSTTGLAARLIEARRAAAPSAPAVLLRVKLDGSA